MYTYNYPHPAVTADCLVFAHTDEGMKLLLIQRKNEPYKGKWAFPGGFMDIDETTIDAARRELKEETGLVVGELHRVGIFDAVDRDPRERIITVAYYTILDKPTEVSGLDDAAQAKWFSLTELPDLAFDHKEILQEAERVLGDG
ncbi:NUDIX hydrolase [Prevotella melaninogenica]|uniref:NUDIX domain-containing protein n=1 Tax=Prevotella melaninogenica TaxID=28132 RepID=UPI001BAD8FC2|nr:NUDIX hydrolase [Prevotella melaninogenica]QUB64503.1 NUDIX hydrolase [Prevotella melaninogenica]